MKPMIALVVFGAALLLTVFFIAKNHFDGVVEDNTYDAALKYDETVVNMNNIEKAVGAVKAGKDGEGVSVGFVFNPSDTVFPNTVVKEAALVRPGGGMEYVLKKSGDNYRFSGDIPSGWYNLKLLCSDGNMSVTVSKSIYVD